MLRVPVHTAARLSRQRGLVVARAVASSGHLGYPGSSCVSTLPTLARVPGTAGVHRAPSLISTIHTTSLTALTGAAPGESDTVVDVERKLDGAPGDWDEEKVQTWFETHNRGQWVEYASKFKGLSGQQMSALSEEAFLRRVPINGDVIYNDWQALLNPSTPNEVLTAMKHNVEKLEKLRAEPKFELLKKLGSNDRATREAAKAELDGMRNTWLDLPDLAPMIDRLPKDMPPGEKKLLLTADRIEVLQFVSDLCDPAYPSELKGVVLSAGHGLGKTFTTYAQVCIGVMAGCPTLYIPMARRWVADSNPDLFLLEQFALLNADLLGAEADATMKGIMRELQKAFTGSDAAICRAAIMKALGEYKAHPVMYVIDEHNELWKGADSAQRLPFERNPFREFATWLGQTAGVRTIAIYCGSAHSKFENAIPGGMQEFKRFLAVMDATATKEAMENSVNMALRLPADVERAVFPEIRHQLGGVPRCMKWLSRNCSREKWLAVVNATAGAAAAQAMKGDDLRTMLRNAPEWYDLAADFVLDGVYKAATTAKDAMGETIDANFPQLSKKEQDLFTHFAFCMITNESNTPAPAGLYDAGMIYRTPPDEGSSVHLVNAAASRALLARLDVDNFRGYAGQSNSASGDMYEKESLFREFGASEPRLHACGPAGKDLPRPVERPSAKLEYYDRVADWSPRTAPYRYGVAFTPAIDNWKYLDYMLVYVNKPGEHYTVRLKQITKKTVGAHMKVSKNEAEALFHSLEEDVRKALLSEHKSEDDAVKACAMVGEVILACQRKHAIGEAGNLVKYNPTTHAATQPVSVVEAMLHRAGFPRFTAHIGFDEDNGCLQFSYSAGDSTELTVQYIYGSAAKATEKDKDLPITGVFYYALEDHLGWLNMTESKND